MTPEERQAFHRIFDLMLRPASRKMAKKALDRSPSRATAIDTLLAHPEWLEDWPATRQRIARKAGAQRGLRDVTIGSPRQDRIENRMEIMTLLAHVAEPPSARNVIDRMLQMPLRRRL
jgi:hypothetical protein